MKKKFVTTFVTLMTFMAAMPMNTYAANQTVTVTSNETKNREVKASITVTDKVLEELGLNIVVSLPTELVLSLDGNQDFLGSDKIYAYGIMGSDNTLSVVIDTTNEAYGKVKYRKEASSLEVDSTDNFFATVTENLTKESFTAEETKTNYLAQKNGKDMTNYTELKVSIQGLIPTSGTGIYYTNVPIKMEIQ